MKRALSLLALGLPVLANAATVEGVDMDAVPWAELCPSVEAVELRTSTGSCTVTHPASKRHAKWDGFGMGVEEPKPNCKSLEREYRKWTAPKRTGGKVSTNTDIAWGFCKGAFKRALELRASEPQRFDESFEQWRARYFGAWLDGGKG